MPYYRILVWTKIRKEPYQGIRLINDDNINAVFQFYAGKAYEKYRDKYIEIEVQMLSKLCPAVRKFEMKSK